jgi:tetratricopeptide (TPR) repeat protein
MSKEEQIEELQEILREDSENYRARRELALVLIDAGFPKEASQHLRYLIRKIPDDIQLYYNLGIAYEKQKLFELAKDSYMSALNLEPENLDATYNLGLVYLELKDYKKCVECFNKVLAKDCNDSNSYFNLGLSYLKQGDTLKALENFQNTIDINNDDLYAHSGGDSFGE